jgi:hypothetical protein
MMQYLNEQQHDVSDHTLSSPLKTHDFISDIGFFLFIWDKPRFLSWDMFVSNWYLIYTSRIVHITWKITYRYKNTGSFFYHHTKHGSCTSEIQYLSEHPVTAAMLNTAVEETWCIICRGLFELLQIHVAADWIKCDVNIFDCRFVQFFKPTLCALKCEHSRYTISYMFQHFLSASSRDSLMIAIKIMSLKKCQNMKEIVYHVHISVHVRLVW